MSENTALMLLSSKTICQSSLYLNCPPNSIHTSDFPMIKSKLITFMLRRDYYNIIRF